MGQHTRFGSLRPFMSESRPRGAQVRACRPRLESMEERQLLATLAPVSNVSVPVNLGTTVPLTGGSSNQIYQVSSSNASVPVSVINGPFLKIDVSHASSGVGDPAFTGSLVFQLFEDLTPVTVSRILELVQSGFYTSPTEPTGPTDTSFVSLPTKNFHRVADGFPGLEFIVQGGSKNGAGTGEINRPGFPFNDEFVQPLAFTGRGQLAMANAGDDTNSSQFFVTTGQPGFLDFQHTIFGQLVSGFDTLTQMTQVARNADDTPLSPILITGTSQSEASPHGVLLVNTSASTVNQMTTVTVTATDPADNTTATQTFQVNVVANTENQRPFLGPIGNQVVGRNQVSRFRLTATSTNPGDVLTFRVGGGVGANGLFAPVQNATATVDSQGNVTVTPNAGFTGDIDLLVGVRDQINRTQSSIDSVANFDTQRITLRVLDNAQPTANPQTVTARENTPVSIQLTGDTNNPGTGQTLTYIQVSQPANGQILNFNANTGMLTYNPNPNFVGTDQFTFRVRDVGEPGPNLESEVATVTINVEAGEPINLPPVARPVSANVTANQPVMVQLIGENGNPNSGQTLVYQIDTTNTRGTISNFDPNAGTFVYQPPLNYIGTDTLSYTVTDQGPPLPPLTSTPATVTFTIGGDVDTGSVRVVDKVLLITPPPGKLHRPSPNAISVSIVDGRIVTVVNGLIDITRPVVGNIGRIVVYGRKASDTILISPDIPQTVTLDGGLGGSNTLHSGDNSSRLHGWFGRNTLRGGASWDALIGRMGRVRFKPSGGNDLLFAGETDRRPTGLGDPIHRRIVPPDGQFYRFVNGRLVPRPTPPKITFRA